MIVPDSSVWIAGLRDANSAGGLALVAVNPDLLLVGDLVMLEVLQGARNDEHAARLERTMRRFQIGGMMGPELAVKAAENYRTLRAKGITIRKTVDLIIGTFCIEYGHKLMHQDRGFDAMETHLGLLVAR